MKKMNSKLNPRKELNDLFFVADKFGPQFIKNVKFERLMVLHPALQFYADDQMLRLQGLNNSIPSLL